MATGCSAAAATTVVNRPIQTAIARFIPTSIQPGSTIRTAVVAVGESTTLLRAWGSNTPSVADVCVTNVTALRFNRRGGGCRDEESLISQSLVNPCRRHLSVTLRQTGRSHP